MDKLFGYTELNMSWGVLPIKICIYTLEELCKDFEIGLYEVPTLFINTEYINGEEKQIVEVPREPTKFLRCLLLHGANYVRLHSGEPLFKPLEAYEWVNEIGFNSEEAFRIIYLFLSVTKTGKPAKLPEGEQDKKKEEEVL